MGATLVFRIIRDSATSRGHDDVIPGGSAGISQLTPDSRHCLLRIILCSILWTTPLTSHACIGTADPHFVFARRIVIKCEMLAAQRPTQVASNLSATPFTIASGSTHLRATCLVFTTARLLFHFQGLLARALRTLQRSCMCGLASLDWPSGNASGVKAEHTHFCSAIVLAFPVQSFTAPSSSPQSFTPCLIVGAHLEFPRFCGVFPLATGCLLAKTLGATSRTWQSSVIRVVVGFSPGRLGLGIYFVACVTTARI